MVHGERGNACLQTARSAEQVPVIDFVDEIASL
jgi:hypothetical protein